MSVSSYEPPAITSESSVSDLISITSPEQESSDLISVSSYEAPSAGRDSSSISTSSELVSVTSYEVIDSSEELFTDSFRASFGFPAPSQRVNTPGDLVAVDSLSFNPP